MHLSRQMNALWLAILPPLQNGYYKPADKTTLYNIERESDKRQEAMADLPHMKRFKTKMKRRQLKQILHDMAGESNFQWQRYKFCQRSWLMELTNIFQWLHKTFVGIVI